MNSRLNEFLEEVKELQDKYDMYIKAEYEELWEEDCNGDMYYFGGRSYLVVYDKEIGAEYIVSDDLDDFLI